MPGPNPRLGKPLPITRDEVTATAPHTYPPARGEDGPPMRRPPPQSRPEVPFEDALDALTEATERISQLHAEPVDRELEDKAERARIRRAWNAVGLKIAGSIAAILAAVALYFGVWAKYNLEPKVADTKAVVKFQSGEADALAKRLGALEVYDRKKHVRDLCVQSMEHSAFARGTGHDLAPLTDTGVHWTSENMPKLQLRVIWDAPPFYPLTQCPPEPVPPGCTAIGCPEEPAP